MTDHVDRMHPMRVRMRLVLLGIVIGCFYKIAFFRFCDHWYFEYPLRDTFFPGWLQNGWTLRVAYVGLLAGVLLAAFSDAPRRLVTGWSVALACLTVLNLHQGSYNDMTFLTAWWGAVWGLWIAMRLQIDAPEELLRKSSLVGRLVLSVVLLGGAVGKWTGEYWSGQVMFEIYFRDRDFWTFNLARQFADAETLRQMSTGYSRFVILTESIGGLTLWLWPRRMAAIGGAGVFVSIALFSNFNLISVIAPLVALSLACWPSTLAARRKNGAAADDASTLPSHSPIMDQVSPSA